MILGIGIDIVDIDRFVDWNLKPMNQLKYIFSAEEISYCLEIPLQSAERFAVRFAAKEAFYKSYCAWQTQAIPFNTVAKWISVCKSSQGIPHLKVNWQQLNVPFEPFCHVTLSHAKTVAIAYVVLESNTINS